METKKRLFELIECLEHCADNTDCERCSRWLHPCDEHCVDDLLATAAKELKKLVDAVEVVRCKDCKYYRPPFCLLNDNKHGWLNHVLPEHFCSYGERRC